MSFRFRKFKPLSFVPVPVQVEKQVSNFDDNGVQHISFASVSAQSIIDSMPSPSETTIASQLASGSLKPVSLDDYQVNDFDPQTASTVINSLNASDNENS